MSNKDKKSVLSKYVTGKPGDYRAREESDTEEDQKASSSTTTREGLMDTSTHRPYKPSEPGQVSSYYITSFGNIPVTYRSPEEEEEEVDILHTSRFKDKYKTRGGIREEITNFGGRQREEDTHEPVILSLTKLEDLVRAEKYASKHIFKLIKNKQYDQAVNYIANLNIKSLGLPFGHLDEKIKYIVEGLIKNNHIEDVSIPGNNIGRSHNKDRIHGLGIGHVSHIVNLINNNTTIKSLDLDSNGFTNIDIKLISDALINNHTIRKLSIRFNDITIYGVPHIANLIRYNDTLQKLSIKPNYIDKNEEVEITEALDNNTVIIGGDIKDYNKNAIKRNLRMIQK